MGRRVIGRDGAMWILVALALASCAAPGAPRSTGSSHEAPPPAPRNAPLIPPAPPPALPPSEGPPTTALTEPGPPEKPAPPVRRPGAYANLDPDDDYVVGPPDPWPDCEAELTRMGVKFRVGTLPIHTPPKSKITCGAAQVVTYFEGPGHITYNAAPFMTCSMALALASFERILQKEANALFGSPVARIDQLGTYNCREIAAYPGWVSEHSYANAIDIGRFVLKNGKSIEVLRDFDVGEAAPSKSAAAFLRVVSRRANDEDVFSHVLTPFFDANHKNHFHLDLSRYRADGTRPQ